MEDEEAKGLLRRMGKMGVVLRESYADSGSMIMGGVESMGEDLVYSKIIEALEITRREKEKLPARAKIHGSPPT